MKRISRRARLMFVFVALFMAGIIALGATLTINAESWVFKRANLHIYTSGQMVAAGAVTDRNGISLAYTQDGERVYNDSRLVRRATLHAVGDLEGFISTGAHTAFKSQLTGYSMVNGVYELKRNGAGNDIRLTIDANLCATALEALGSRKGTVGVYNYKTGEILCMVSSPTYDPENKPENIDSDTSGKYDGIYLNRFLSGVFTPGSTFKVITAVSAIENMPDIYSRTFRCNGAYQTSTGEVRCNGVHGTVSFEQALNKSCNSAFACIAEELGNDKLSATTDKLKFNKNLSVDGISVTRSTFDLSGAVSVDRGWAGIGQYTTLANPCHMLSIVGAIANGGSSPAMHLLEQTDRALSLADGSSEYMSSDTAAKAAALMRSNVENQYGDGRFPGLQMCGKTGTAEVTSGDPHAWFVGFSQREDLPLAVVVVVENGGEGASAALPIANTVLQAAD